MKLPQQPAATTTAEQAAELKPLKDRLYSLDHAIANPWPWALGILFTAAFAIWHVATNVFINESGLWQNTIHFGGFAFLAAITTRTFNRGKQSRTSIIGNALFGIAMASSALWIAQAENGIYQRTLAETGLPAVWPTRLASRFYRNRGCY